MNCVYKKNKNKLSGIGSAKRSIAFFMCLLCFCSFAFTSYASEDSSNIVVRVGFFDFEGYHETGEQGQRSGYGYEYLHEMAKYTGWIFEYVDGTWDECQEMLKNGEIDLLTSAQYSEKREEVFDFSSTSMGTSYAQLTVADGNTTYSRNDFANFSGMKIGLLNGNSRNDKLASYATEMGFTYIPKMYDTQEELDLALQTGSVDSVLTSNLRKLNQERVIAQFAPSPFYAVVKEGNQELLNEVNEALELIEMNTPAFRYNLFQEYYRVDTSDTFILSREEQEYLDAKPTIRAVIRPGVSPLSDWEEGKFDGISADMMEYLLDGLDIKVEYICPDSLEEGYEMLTDGSADIACMFESDYNLAEEYGTRITAPYLSTYYSIVSRKQSGKELQAAKKIAVSKGSLTGIRYIESYYPDAEISALSSNYDAIEAVSKGKADMAVTNIYSAERALTDFTNLRATFISNEEQQFSVGVSQQADSRLYSILDKKINAMSSQVFNDILYEHTMFNQKSMSLGDYFRQHPMQIILISLIIFLVVIGILLYIMLINKKHANRIYNLAYIDELTGLWNMNGFVFQGNSLLGKKNEEDFAVVTIDLSKFSTVNENHGRETGDKVIQSMSNMLRRFQNEQTIVAHADGDHFLILFSYMSWEDLQTTLTAIAGTLTSYTIEDLTLRFNVHVGVGLVERKEGALLHAIDQAGVARNRCDTENPIVYMDKALRDRLQREKEIYDHVEIALEKGEFQVFLQPKVEMSSKKIFGAEALIRWNHSKLGFLSPAEFIPILEQSGVITEIDFFVLDQACKLVRKWLDAGLTPIIVSVNQSRAHFLKKDYVDRLQNMLIQYNIPAGYIELEITETLLGQETVSDIMIKKMRSMGLLISIDDFGSGYSSLYLLHQISVDILKIDKGLLDEGGKHEKVRNIMRRIIQIASDIDVDVICEGVETEEQVEFLMGIGCPYAQGYLFGRPVPQQEFELMLERTQSLEKERG